MYSDTAPYGAVNSPFFYEVLVFIANGRHDLNQQVATSAAFELVTT